MDSELWLIGTVAGTVSFLIDTGVAFSLLTSLTGPLQPSEVAIKGCPGIPFYPKITPPLLCSFGESESEVVSDSLLPHGWRSLVWDFPCKSTVVGCHFLLHGIFPKATLTHSFIVVPQCPVALMGCDLLVKLQTSINLPFLDPILILCIQMAPKPLASPHTQNLPPDFPPIDPQVWDTEAPSVA